MLHDARASTMTHDEIVALLVSNEQLVTQTQQLSAEAKHLATRAEEMARQIAWFKQQLFGQTSERRLVGTDARQLAFGELEALTAAPDASVTVCSSYYSIGRLSFSRVVCQIKR